MRVFIDNSAFNRYDTICRVAIAIESTGKTVRKIVKGVGERLTSNQTEYQALIEALSLPEVKDCTIYTDSKLLFGQLTLDWKVRMRHLQEPHDTCAKLLKEKNCRLDWIPKAENPAGKLLTTKRYPESRF